MNFDTCKIYYNVTLGAIGQTDNLNISKTAFYDVIYQAVRQLKRKPSRKVIIALTDGINNTSQHNLGSTVDYATNSQPARPGVGSFKMCGKKLS